MLCPVLCIVFLVLALLCFVAEVVISRYLSQNYKDMFPYVPGFGPQGGNGNNNLGKSSPTQHMSLNTTGIYLSDALIAVRSGFAVFVIAAIVCCCVACTQHSPNGFSSGSRSSGSMSGSAVRPSGLNRPMS